MTGVPGLSTEDSPHPKLHASSLADRLLTYGLPACCSTKASMWEQPSGLAMHLRTGALTTTAPRESMASTPATSPFQLAAMRATGPSWCANALPERLVMHVPTTTAKALPAQPTPCNSEALAGMSHCEALACVPQSQPRPRTFFSSCRSGLQHTSEICGMSFTSPCAGKRWGGVCVL